jgi:hypothetical protein
VVVEGEDRSSATPDKPFTALELIFPPEQSVEPNPHPELLRIKRLGESPQLGGGLHFHMISGAVTANIVDWLLKQQTSSQFWRLKSHARATGLWGGPFTCVVTWQGAERGRSWLKDTNSRTGTLTFMS